MGIQVNIGEAKTQLSKLIAAAKRGEDVIIALNGAPAVRMLPVVESPATAREALAAKLKAFHGSFKGRLDMSLDWEAPSMTEDEVRAWEEREAVRYSGSADEAAA